ncbi:hypothetical protein NLM33_08105 [Bradyrhizobium sp. CCGUVB1N3]|uniref:hypothetical protein n=1 Tax=Bradyrhizobium sp. CCGUVB1N3 TaxID=2949629 RepID=UPI0020B2CBD4|nr:hypothetical protein [Bradyrhizobium sp. CCGUVB1N3]MCP3470285.1 hypothetical protein [Bradyrhizobium sp. CCGUVB1N3]
MAKTAPAEETSRQAPIRSEVVGCFIWTLPFKVMLRIGKIAQRVPTDSSSILLIVRWWDVVADSKHQTGADHPETIQSFLDHVLSGDFK